MGVSLSKYRKARLIVVVIFAAVALVLVAAWVSVPKIKSEVAYVGTGLIYIDGNHEFVPSRGVVSGTGSEWDPYVIEGWSQPCTDVPGITLVNTSSHVIVRNVTIDGRDSYNFGSDGIYIRNSSNVTLENLMIRWADRGIIVEGDGSSPVQAIEIRGCSIRTCMSSISVANATDVRIEDCMLWASAKTSVLVSNCTELTLSDNNIRRYFSVDYSDLRSYSVNVPDVSIRDSNNTSVYDNKFRGSGYQLTLLETRRCQKVEVFDNLFGSSIDYSAKFYESNEVSFNNNSCRGVTLISCDECDVLDNWGAGAYAEGVSHLRIARNVGQYIGVAMMNGADSLIEDNIITSASVPMTLHGSNITVRHNLVNDCQREVSLEGDNFTFSHNEIRNPAASGRTVMGVSATASNWILMTDNFISVSPDSRCVDLTSSNNVTIANCSLTGDIGVIEVDGLRLVNCYIGGNATIRFYSSIFGTREIFGNSMYNVTVYRGEDYSSPSISWDNGYPGGGNYWSQYVGIDERSGANQNQPGPDGIGDTPFAITPDDIDQYPLMSPVLHADNVAPSTVLTLNGLYQWDSPGWYISEANFTLETVDQGSGVESTMYRIDSGEWNNYTAEVVIPDDGVHLLEYYSADTAGNTELIRRSIVRIDTEAPWLVSGMPTEIRLKNTDTTVLHFEFEDNLSGVVSYRLYSPSLYVDSWMPASIPFAQVPLKDGEHSYTVSASDEAGNWAQVIILTDVSLNENRDPMSRSGPYGIWFDIALFAEIFLLSVILWLSSVLAWGPIPPPRGGTGKEPGEIDKDEVVDGYPKYLKKV